jgi:hypothetical protein
VTIRFVVGIWFLKREIFSHILIKLVVTPLEVCFAQFGNDLDLDK